jgi:hypothetical protein
VSPKFSDKVTSLPKTKLHRLKQTQFYLLTKTAAIGSREASEFWCHNETIKVYEKAGARKYEEKFMKARKKDLGPCNPRRVAPCPATS